MPQAGKSGLSKGALAGIIVAALAVSALILALIAALFLARVKHKPLTPAQRRRAQLRKFCSPLNASVSQDQNKITSFPN